MHVTDNRTKNNTLWIRERCFSPKNGALSVSKIQSYLRVWFGVQLTRVDLDPRAEMDPSVGWNSLLMGLFWIKLCSNDSRRGWIRLWPVGLNWHFRAETDLFNFQCTRTRHIPLACISLRAFWRESLASFSLSRARFNRLLAASEASRSFFSSASVCKINKLVSYQVCLPFTQTNRVKICVQWNLDITKGQWTGKICSL